MGELLESFRITPDGRAADDVDEPGADGIEGAIVELCAHPASVAIAAMAESRVQFILPSSKVAGRINQVYKRSNIAVNTMRSEFLAKMIVVQ
jgi:hypothetical protein